MPRPTALEGLSEVGQLDTLPPYRQPLYSLPPPFNTDNKHPFAPFQMTFAFARTLRLMDEYQASLPPTYFKSTKLPQPFFRSFFRIFTFQPLHLNFEHQNSAL